VPPIVILIVLESLGWTGYGGGQTVCFLNVSQPVAGIDTGLIVFLVLIPFTLMQIIGFSSLMITIYIIWKNGGVQAILKQTRLLAFLATFGSTLVVTMVLFWQYSLWDIDSTVDYLECLVNNWALDLLVNGSDQKVDCKSVASTPALGDRFTFIWHNFLAAVIYGFLLVIFFAKDNFSATARKSKKSTSGTTTRTHSVSRAHISGLSLNSQSYLSGGSKHNLHSDETSTSSTP